MQVRHLCTLSRLSILIDALQVTGLVHDLGKLLVFFGSEGQWDVVGVRILRLSVFFFHAYRLIIQDTFGSSSFWCQPNEMLISLFFPQSSDANSPTRLFTPRLSQATPIHTTASSLLRTESTSLTVGSTT